MMTLIYLLIPLFLAFAYRARGGAIPLGSTTEARIIFWAIPILLCSLAVADAWHLPLWLAPLAAMCGFGGACIGHASAQGNEVEDYFSMTWIVQVMLVLTLAPFYTYLCFLHTMHPFTWAVTIIFGWLAFPACALGYKMTIGLRGWGIQWCVPGDSSWEEFFIGAIPFGITFAYLCLLAG